MGTNSSHEEISIGVVVPNYNHGRFLTESLSSIARQSRQPEEVLIIDDGSTDDSVAVIAHFLKDHPTWRLVRHTERRGAVRRLNEGVTEIHTAWVTLLGADDVLGEEYLKIASQMATEHPSVGMICGCVEIFGQDISREIRPPILPRNTRGYISPDEFRKLLRIGDNYFLGTATLYRRQTITDLTGFDEELGSLCDGFLSRQIAARHGFVFIPEVLGYWRIHGQNYSVSTATDPQVLNKGIRLVQRALNREPAGTFPRNYSRTLERQLRFSGIRLIVLDKNIPARVRAAQIAKMIKAGPFEQFMLGCLLSGGSPGAMTALAWLTTRLRPLSLPRLLWYTRQRRAISAATKNTTPQ